MQTIPFVPLLDEEVKDLIKEIQLKNSTKLFRELIVKIQEKCRLPEIKKRYQALEEPTGYCGKYPTDSEGFAVAYDPIEQEMEFWNAWSTYGYVVGKEVISKEQCTNTIARIKSLLKEISSNTFDLDIPETYDEVPADENGIPAISRGFFEVYHDDSLAQIRQAIKVYIHHVLLWGKAELWTTFDRFGIKMADAEEAKGLPLHVDQNPLVHPGFKTTQGVLALIDCPVKQGTFVAVPGSRGLFADYARAIEKFDPKYRGEYVEAGWDTDLNQRLAVSAQPIPIRAGDLVSWDSRTTHANSTNLLNTPRLVVYISAGPVPEDFETLQKERMAVLQSGEGKNVREAMIHASKPPRCALHKRMEQLRHPEQLNLLGKLLYGQESYPAAD
jgi:ectoine hydroxylase-related dioxygenase (phytanoyl-CoA dioxygenase family)